MSKYEEQSEKETGKSCYIIPFPMLTAISTYKHYKNEYIDWLEQRLEQVEEDIGELLFALKAIKESVDDNCISDAQLILKAMLETYEVK